MAKIIMDIYALMALVITLAGLAWMLIAPPQSLRADRDGVAYFTPSVIQPETGKDVSVNDLIKNYRGD